MAVDGGFAFDDRTIGLTEEQTEILGAKLREWGHFLAVDALADDNREQLVGLMACLLRTWTERCEDPPRPTFHSHVMSEVWEGARDAVSS